MANGISSCGISSSGSSPSTDNFTIDGKDLSVVKCNRTSNDFVFQPEGTLSYTPSIAVSKITVTYAGSNNSKNIDIKVGDTTLGTITAPKAAADASCTFATQTANTTFTFAPAGKTQITKITFESEASCSAPVFSLADGTYTGMQNVTITSETDGAAIYYTTNGTDPTASSTLYTAPVAIDDNTTLKAISVKAGLTNSAVSSATYNINYVVYFGANEDEYGTVSAVYTTGGAPFSSGSTVSYETQLTFTATPNLGYKFDNTVDQPWGNATGSKDNPLTYTIKNGKNFVAKFAALTSPTISAQQTENATYTQNQSQDVQALSVTAATSEGGTLAYQWYRNNTNSTDGADPIPDATTSTYTPSTEEIGTSYYFCVVTENVDTRTDNGTRAYGAQTVTSNIAEITVGDSRTAITEFRLMGGQKDLLLLKPSETTTPIMYIRDIGGNTVAAANFSFTSSDPEVATVSFRTKYDGTRIILNITASATNTGTVTITPNFLGTNELQPFVGTPFTVTVSPAVTLNYSAGTGGTVAAVSKNNEKTTYASGSTFAAGREVKFTATPEAWYLFDNWHDGTNYVGNGINPYITAVNENLTLTANFIRGYKFRATANDADWGTVKILDANGAEIGDDALIGKNDVIRPVATAKPGYTFVRWEYTTTELQTVTEATFSNKAGNFYPAAEDVIAFTAIFEVAPQNARSITYEANTTPAPAPVVDPGHAEGSDVTILGKPDSFDKAGYHFYGWNTAADGTGTFYAANSILTITDDITLYAQWHENSIDEGTTVGTLNCAFGTHFSSYNTLARNSAVIYEFTNDSKGEANWQNWNLCITSDADRGSSTEYLWLRSDIWGWGTKYDANNWKTTNYPTNDDQWTTFRENMKGAKVTVTISRQEDNSVKVTAVATKGNTSYTEEYTTEATAISDSNVRTFLTTDHSSINNLRLYTGYPLTWEDTPHGSVTKVHWDGIGQNTTAELEKGTIVPVGTQLTMVVEPETGFDAEGIIGATQTARGEENDKIAIQFRMPDGPATVKPLFNKEPQVAMFNMNFKQSGTKDGINGGWTTSVSNTNAKPCYHDHDHNSVQNCEVKWEGISSGNTEGEVITKIDNSYGSEMSETYVKMAGDMAYIKLKPLSGQYFAAGDRVVVKMLSTNSTTVGVKTSTSREVYADDAVKGEPYELIYVLEESDIDSDGAITIMRPSTNGSSYRYHSVTVYSVRFHIQAKPDDEDNGTAGFTMNSETTVRNNYFVGRSNKLHFSAEPKSGNMFDSWVQENDQTTVYSLDAKFDKETIDTEYHDGLIDDDLSLVARFGRGAKVSVTSKTATNAALSAAGNYVITTDVSGEKYAPGETIRPFADLTITAQPVFGYTFEGWYDASDNKVSSEVSYNIGALNGTDKNLVAKYTYTGGTHTWTFTSSMPTQSPVIYKDGGNSIENNEWNWDSSHRYAPNTTDYTHACNADGTVVSKFAGLEFKGETRLRSGDIYMRNNEASIRIPVLKGQVVNFDMKMDTENRPAIIAGADMITSFTANSRGTQSVVATSDGYMTITRGTNNLTYIYSIGLDNTLPHLSFADCADAQTILYNANPTVAYNFENPIVGIMPTDAVVSWSSSDASKVEVDSNGKLTIKPGATGNYTITANITGPAPFARTMTYTLTPGSLHFELAEVKVQLSENGNWVLDSANPGQDVDGGQSQWQDVHEGTKPASCKLQNLTNEKIVNAGFESVTSKKVTISTGWTNSGSVGAWYQNNEQWAKTDTWYAEVWHQAGTMDLNQEITLAEGRYRLSANINTNQPVSLYAGGIETVAASGVANYAVEINVPEGGASVKIGIKAETTDQCWIAFDNFQLEKVCDLPTAHVTYSIEDAGDYKGATVTTDDDGSHPVITVVGKTPTGGVKVRATSGAVFAEYTLKADGFIFDGIENAVFAFGENKKCETSTTYTKAAGGNVTDYEIIEAYGAIKELWEDGTVEVDNNGVVSGLPAYDDNRGGALVIQATNNEGRKTTYTLTIPYKEHTWQFYSELTEDGEGNVIENLSNTNIMSPLSYGVLVEGNMNGNTPNGIEGRYNIPGSAATAADGGTFTDTKEECYNFNGEVFFDDILWNDQQAAIRKYVEWKRNQLLPVHDKKYDHWNLIYKTMSSSLHMTTGLKNANDEPAELNRWHYTYFNEPLFAYRKAVTGDNARIITNTAGLVFNAPAGSFGVNDNNSSVNEEPILINNKTVTGVQIREMDRAVLMKGKTTTLTVPYLKKGQYVRLLWYRHSTNAGDQFSVTNAEDLDGNAINPDDVLRFTGSAYYNHTNGSGEYKGCTFLRALEDGNMVIRIANSNWTELYQIDVTDKFETHLTVEAGKVSPSTTKYEWGGSTSSGYEQGDHWNLRENALSVVRNKDCKDVLTKADICEYGRLDNPKMLEKNAPIMVDNLAKLPSKEIGDNPIIYISSYPGLSYTWNGWNLAVECKPVEEDASSLSIGLIQDSWTHIGNNADYRMTALSNFRGTGTAKVVIRTQSGDAVYTLDKQEAYFPVGEYQNQTYPYTWDFTKYNMDGDTISVEERTPNYMNRSGKNSYGGWSNGETDVYKMRTVAVVPPSGDNVSQAQGNGETYNKWIFADGSQLVTNLETNDGATYMREAEGLRFKLGRTTDQMDTANETDVKFNYTHDAVAPLADGDIHGNDQDLNAGGYAKRRAAKHPSTATDRYDSSLALTGGVTMTIPNVDKGMYIFIKSNKKPDSAKYPDDSDVSHMNADGAEQNMYVFHDDHVQHNSNGSVMPEVDVPMKKDDVWSDVYVYKVEKEGLNDVSVTFPNDTKLYAVGVTNEFKNIPNAHGWMTDSRTLEIDYNNTFVFSKHDIHTYVAVDNSLTLNSSLEGSIHLDERPVIDSYEHTGLTQPRGLLMTDRSYFAKSASDAGEVWEKRPANVSQYTERRMAPLFVPACNISYDKISDNILIGSLGNEVAIDPSISGEFYNFGLTNGYFNKNHVHEVNYYNPVNGYDFYITWTGGDLRKNSAYLHVDESVLDGNDPGARFRQIYMFYGFTPFEEKDGIDAPIVDVSSHAKGIYRMDGTRLSTLPTKKGIYIINGKKVYVK